MSMFYLGSIRQFKKLLFIVFIVMLFFCALIACNGDSEEVIPSPSPTSSPPETIYTPIYTPNNQDATETAQASKIPSEDIKFTYRESFDMRIGESKSVLFFLLTDNLAPSGEQPVGRKPHYKFGVLENGELTSLPKGIEIVKRSTRFGMPFPTAPKTEVKFQTSFDIFPGSYEITVEIEADGLGVIGQVPFIINVVESGDDICDTSHGPVYRANDPELNNGQWPSIDEAIVPLTEATEENEAMVVKYRDSIATKVGEPIGIIFTLNTGSSEFEYDKIEYSIHKIQDGSVQSLPHQIELVKTNSYYGSESGELVSVLILRSLDFSWHPSPFSLVVQVADGDDVLGQLPLTIDVAVSGDDLTSGPGGPFYYAGVKGPDQIVFPRVEQTTIILIDVDEGG